MLLTKTVQVRVSGKEQNYYREKGYEIPTYIDKRGRVKVKLDTKIDVDVYDLPLYSRTKIEYLCDNCNKTFQTNWCDYISINHKGKYYCRLCSLKVLHSGENHKRWKFDKTNEERENQRCYPEYTEFIKRVLARDNYKCQKCNQEKCKLFVHHLNGYNWFKEGRTDETNAITLCENCHKNFHMIYGSGNNTKEQFEEWFDKPLDNLTKYNGDIIKARLAYCLEDKEIIPSITEYCKKNKIKCRSNIYSCCNKIQKSCYGKHYVWYDEYILDIKDKI